MNKRILRVLAVGLVIIGVASVSTGYFLGTQAQTQNEWAPSTAGAWSIQRYWEEEVASTPVTYGEGFKSVSIGCRFKRGPYLAFYPKENGPQASKVYPEGDSMPASDDDPAWFSLDNYAVWGEDALTLGKHLTSGYQASLAWAAPGQVEGGFVTLESPAGTNFKLEGIEQVTAKVWGDCPIVAQRLVVTPDNVFDDPEASLSSLLPLDAKCAPGNDGNTVCSISLGSAISIASSYRPTPSPNITITMTSWTNKEIKGQPLRTFTRAGTLMGATEPELASCLSTSAATGNMESFTAHGRRFDCQVDAGGTIWVLQVTQ